MSEEKERIYTPSPSSFDSRIDQGDGIVFPDPRFDITEFASRKYLVNANIARERARESAILEGKILPNDIPVANCQLLVALIYDKAFGMTFPNHWLSNEIWKKEDGRFVSVPKKAIQKIGDIYFFKPLKQKGLNPNNPKRYHVAVGTGQFIDIDNHKVPLIVHACKEKEGVVIEPLTNLTRSIDDHPKRYQELVGIRRLEKGLWETHIGKWVGNYLYLNSH